jgi:hypothetical protein
LNFLYASSNESREVSLIPGIKKHPLPVYDFSLKIGKANLSIPLTKASPFGSGYSEVFLGDENKVADYI